MTLLSEHQEPFAPFPYWNIKMFFLYPAEKSYPLRKDSILFKIV